MSVPSNYEALQQRRQEYREKAPWAAVLVQTAVRRLQAKARVARLQREREDSLAAEQEASVVIQARERGNAERKRLAAAAEQAEQEHAATAIQSAVRNKALRRSLVATQAALKAASFKRRKTVLENDQKDARRRRSITEANLVELEAQAAAAAEAAEAHQRRARINKIKRQDERNAKRLALEAEAQRQQLRDRAANVVGSREARIAADAEEKQQDAQMADSAFATQEQHQMRLLNQRLKESLVVNLEHEVAAQEDYAVRPESIADWAFCLCCSNHLIRRPWHCCTSDLCRSRMSVARIGRVSHTSARHSAVSAATSPSSSSCRVVYATHNCTRDRG
eukprot:COSAG06_NODE_10543_length_1662_cov_1.711452_2_plen_336_part_00